MQRIDQLPLFYRVLRQPQALRAHVARLLLQAAHPLRLHLHLRLPRRRVSLQRRHLNAQVRDAAPLADIVAAAASIIVGYSGVQHVAQAARDGAPYHSGSVSHRVAQRCSIHATATAAAGRPTAAAAHASDDEARQLQGSRGGQRDMQRRGGGVFAVGRRLGGSDGQRRHHNGSQSLKSRACRLQRRRQAGGARLRVALQRTHSSQRLVQYSEPLLPPGGVARIPAHIVGCRSGSRTRVLQLLPQPRNERRLLRNGGFHRRAHAGPLGRRGRWVCRRRCSCV